MFRIRLVSVVLAVAAAIVAAPAVASAAPDTGSLTNAPTVALDDPWGP
jgi:hypothetical protein